MRATLVICGAAIVWAALHPADEPIVEALPGAVEFCRKWPEECVSVSASKEWSGRNHYADLVSVNLAVNHEIAPATDMEIYGRREVWAIPAEAGDCEDFALLKRKRLISKGWPSSSLLIAVVTDDGDDGHHALLLARTPTQVLVLDNKTDDLIEMRASSYEFVMRQSTVDPKKWVGMSSPLVTHRPTSTERRS